jgi:hypothetical protein
LALLIKKYHNEKIDFFKAWNIFLKKGIYLWRWKINYSINCMWLFKIQGQHRFWASPPQACLSGSTVWQLSPFTFICWKQAPDASFLSNLTCLCCR